MSEEIFLKGLHAPHGSRSAAQDGGPVAGQSLAAHRTAISRQKDEERFLTSVAPLARRWSDLIGTGGVIVGTLLASAMLVRCALRLAGM